MQEKPLLLSSAKIGTLQTKPARKGWVLVLIAFCFVCVTVGVIDSLSRILGGYTPAADTSTTTAPQHMDAAALVSTTVAANSVEPFVPTTLSIPSLNITASVELSGLKPDGSMQAPKHFDTVAWYKDGPMAGAPGNTVIAGHLNNALGLSGIFEKLNTLSLGDTFMLSDKDGHTAAYVVREMSVYDAKSAPNNLIFTTSGPSQAVLITCDGAWDQGARSYDKRLVITAQLLQL